METFEIALIAAGCIGCAVAIVHGILMQKMMIRPILADPSLSANNYRLIPLLLHFSTFFWFFGGAALVATPLMPNAAAIQTTAIFVGLSYAFGAIGNFWGTRGRHPGWMLLAIAAALIVFGASSITA